MHEILFIPQDSIGKRKHWFGESFDTEQANTWVNYELFWVLGPVFS